jgi:uncharacterized membrane protein YccC
MTDRPTTEGDSPVSGGSKLPIIDRFFAKEFSNPDMGRGLRCMASFMAPLALGLSGRLPVEMIFTAMAAQNLANVDVRGSYGLRLSLLLAMSVILAASAAMGALAAPSLAASLLATLLIGLGAGLWRHLSSDYGPSLAIASGFLCFIAMAEKGGPGAAESHALAALVGGCWGALLHVALWPVRPQHPLRQAVGTTWLAVANVCTLSADHGAEAGLRSALDKARAILATARARRNRTVVERLDDLNNAAARTAQRVSALQSAWEEVAGLPASAEMRSAAESALSVLGNLSRAVALAVVSRQPGQLVRTEVRLRRLHHLLGVLHGQISQQPDPGLWAALDSTVGQLSSYLPEVGEALRRTMDRASDQGAFSLELLDLAHLRLRPLTASLNLSWHVDPALARYTARITVLVLIGVWAMKVLELKHGYWLPLTLMVVLQPDYGSTRARAAQRLVGTLAGSILASVVLWLRLPFPVLMAATAISAFGFGFYLRRNYSIAVVFITLFVVVLTESLGPATFDLTVERAGDTLAGGLLALLAAMVFWPVWEKGRFRPILARALRANASYMRIVGEKLAAGRRYDADVVRAKRGAESANAEVFSSLERMSGDPKTFRGQMSELAVVANGNQRVTRALNLIILQAHPDQPLPQARLLAEQRATTLEEMARALQGPATEAVVLELAEEQHRQSFKLGPPPRGPLSPAIALGQLERTGAEIQAMLIGAAELLKTS